MSPDVSPVSRLIYRNYRRNCSSRAIGEIFFSFSTLAPKKERDNTSDALLCCKKWPFFMKITSPFHPIYRMRHLVYWSFPLESVKDEANPICTAEGKEKAEIWNPIWKGRSWRRISVWKSNFDAAAVGSAASQDEKVSNGQQLHICKISENLKTFKFSTTTQNLWSRHGMGCFLFFSEENLSLLVKYQYSLCSCVCWGWMQAKM